MDYLFIHKLFKVAFNPTTKKKKFSDSLKVCQKFERLNQNQK